jgi:predicted component of type VI protein secretion system
VVIIDNPAVSGHHARVVREGDRLVLEDLNSTNGTFVNGRGVTRHALQHGDEVLVGKHTLVFEQSAAPAAAHAPAIPGLGDTVYLDTDKHRALMATLREARAEPAQTAAARSARTVAGMPPTGVLRVVAGRAEQAEYDLEAHTSLIGRSDTALVRLRGWFKPAVAVAIARSGDGYVATLLGGKTLINSRPLNGRHHLKEGDLLSVSGLTLEFGLKNGTSGRAAEREHRGARLMSSGERAATARELT